VAKRISKKVREQAAHICALCASGRDFATYADDAAEHLGIFDGYADPATDLAFRTVVFVERTARHGYSWTRGAYAEAECLLREGWAP
jgi:hypothetical protein